jgi:hypothetical protein
VHAVEAYRDLFSFGDGSLVWLRVLTVGDQEAIAVAVEPSDSPGPSAVNAESLIEALSQVFGGLGALRTFVSWADDSQDRWIEIVTRGDDVDFVRCSATTIEKLVGPVQQIGQNATCADVAGSDHPLLALIPPPATDRDRVGEMSVIAVSDIPWPHNPWKCEFADRFQQLAALYPASHDTPPAVGAHWFLTVSRAELASCPYHAADRTRIAAVAVDVVQGLHQQPEATIEDPAPAIRTVLGETVEAAWCESLFSDPIDYRPDSSRLTNGQHRACAARASGAPLCVVDAGELGILESRARDPRRTAAADVAAFWARHAADMP